MRGAPRALKFGPFELWLLTRYDDVLSGFKRLELFSSLAFRESRPDPTFADARRVAGDARGAREVMRPDVPTVINSDPPQHGRYRGILNRGFTPREIGGSRRASARSPPASSTRCSRAAARRTSSATSRSRCRSR